MIQKIPNLNPKSLFKTVFAAYVLAGLHIQMDHIGGYGLYLPINIIGWMFISLLIGLGIWQIGRTGNIIFSQFHCLCWIGFGLMCVPLLYPNNEYADLAIMRLLGLVGGFALYLSFQQFRFNKHDRYWFLYIILGGILIQNLFGISQHFSPIASSLGLSMKRIYGVLEQKNIMSTFLATGSVISLFLLINDKDVFKIRFKKTLIYLIALLTSILIIPLQSRTGFLTFPLAIIFILFQTEWRKKPILIWLVLTTVGLIIGWKSMSDPRPEQHKTYATGQRKLAYRLSLELWKDNPIMGIGYGKFLSTFRTHYAKRKKEDSSLETMGNSNMDHPHNETLFWTVEGGIIPLAGILIIAGGALIMVWRAKQNGAWAMVGLITPILIHTQLELPFYLSLIHWFIFIFLIYFMDEEYGEFHERKSPLTVFPRVLAVFLPFTVIPYMLTALQTAKVITEFERTGFKNPDLLLTVKNTHAWKKKYETLATKVNLNIAQQTKDYKKLKEYIDWAEGYVKHSPYLFIYYDLATAYQAMGDIGKAWEIYRHAQYLYPGAKWRDLPLPEVEEN